MKKILLAVVLLFSYIGANSQSFRIGAKGAANTTWLLNGNIFDADDEIDTEASFGANAGLSVTHMFSPQLGLSLDILYASVNQHYKGTFDIFGTPRNYTLKEKLRYIDLPLMLKITSEKGPYFEIGPKLSFLMKETQVVESEFPILIGNRIQNGTRSFKNDYNPLIFSIALGFGVDIKVAEHHYITAGLRLAYSPGSALKKISQDELEEDLDNEVGHSFILPYSTYKDGDFTGSDRIFSHKKTNIATGGLLLGYTYEFGGN